MILEYFNNGLIFALLFDGQGGAAEIQADCLSEAFKSAQPKWLHFDQNHPQCRQVLEQILPASSRLVIDALLYEDVRGRAILLHGGILAIMRGVNMHQGYEPEAMVSLRCFLNDSLIITVRKYKVFAAEDLKQALLRGEGPLNSGDFLVQYSFFSMKNLSLPLRKLQNQIEFLEDMIVEENSDYSLKPVSDMRRTILHFLRHLEPQMEVYNSIKDMNLEFLDEITRLHLQEIYHDLCRIVGDLNSWRDRAKLVHEELASSISSKINEKLYILAILTAIFLPLSFLTGLFGINLGGIPGHDRTDAFTIFCLILFMVGIIELSLFRLKKWF